jgi:NADPH-dependent 2,4-dienoyl-CoA reductase/sulfur reductase-like enzyme
MAERAVVVGASMGGLRAVEQLRSAGWDGEIVVVGSERHMPYNRPPLSKEMLRPSAAALPLGQTEVEAALPAVAFRLRASVGAVTWRLGCPATAVSLTDRELRLADGTRLAFDGLVVATGLSPRRLAPATPARGRYVVRTLDDAVALRRALVKPGKVVVIGGGFIGCEVAAAARGLGRAVTVVEPLAVPMAQALGPDLGRALQRHHESRGVRFQLGRTVAGFEAQPSDADRVAAVTLDDGTRLPADVVVEAVGSRANVDWLEGNGLDLSDGLLCDHRLRVEGRPDVVAVGDVARFPNPVFDGVPRRVEHWCVPTDTAKRAAATLAAHLCGRPLDDAAFEPLPWFWSDQFDLRVQSVGAPALGDRSEVLEGELESGDGLTAGAAVGYLRGGRLVGAVLVGLPPSRLSHYRKLVAAPSVQREAA